MNNPLNVGLPKWPGIIVVGKSVTSDQAAEIIIRTNAWYYGCNDKKWEKIVDKVTGLKSFSSTHDLPKDQLNKALALIEKLRDDFDNSIHHIDLEYLYTAWVMSAYIGGPHGWINWDGSIAYGGHNIGKYPSAETVFNEWKLIAEAFPFLDLRCQLMNAEACEDGVPVIEYVINNGTVTAKEPTEIINCYTRKSLEEEMFMLHRSGRERGCDEDTLRRSLLLVWKKFDSVPEWVSNDSGWKRFGIESVIKRVNANT
jgi:hypothetical protein